MMQKLQSQPAITVGLLASAGEVRFRLEGEFVLPDWTSCPAGEYVAGLAEDRLKIQTLDGQVVCSDTQTELRPRDADQGRFTILGVTIGVGFHWERSEDQTFQGVLKVEALPSKHILVVNRVPVESYVTSVISSEMSATSPPELLKAHAIVSRSWLLAQLSPWKVDRRGSPEARRPMMGTEEAEGREIIRWYNRLAHAEFDVCADDHCQRYQGVTKAVTSTVFGAVAETYGLFLVSGREICDARFSKCCGGMTEGYSAAWEDVEVPYLQGVPDAAGPLEGYSLPLTDAEYARHWISGSPPAYCNVADPDVLKLALPDFDQETRDFFRWEVVYRQDELQEILHERLGIDFGRIIRLEPVERGLSGRITKLRILGENRTLIIGKELEIRRVLSRSHLYSSALVIETDSDAPVPSWFRLRGAGWGHGVGLCQIGAAMMAANGQTFGQILGHYYRGASLFQLYG